MTEDNKKPFKVLCIDGGGIKGLYSAQILADFEKEFNTTLADHFDMICGTSTGGIIALAASLGIPMEETVKFYQEDGPKIFADKAMKRKLYRISRLIIQASFGSKYSPKPLKSALINAFGDKKIGDCKTLLGIPAFNIISGKTRVFKRDYEKFTRDNGFSCVDVALATSAAPTYFPAHKIGDELYVDGGLWANNPIIVALTEYIYTIKQTNRFDGLSVLSISSCEKPYGETPDEINRGFLGWRHTLFDYYSLGQSQSNLFLFEKLKQDMDFQLSIERIKNGAISGKQDNLIEMDNASKDSLTLLKSIAEQTFNDYKNKEEIRVFFNTGKTINDIDNFFKK